MTLPDPDSFPRIVPPGYDGGREDILIPNSLYMLGDGDLFEFYERVSALAAFAEETEGRYAAALADAEDRAEDIERVAYVTLYPEGKGTKVTAGEARSFVCSVDDVQEARRALVGIRGSHAKVKAFNRAYVRLVFMASQVIKYRGSSHDRPPPDPPEDPKAEFPRTSDSNWNP